MLSKDVTVFLCFFLNWFSYYFICCCKIIISFILFSSLFSVLCIQLLEEVWRSFFLVKNWFLFELLSSLNLFILWTYHTNLIDSCYNVAPSVVGVLSPSKFVLPFLSSIPHSVYNSLLSCFFSFFACLLPSFFASFFPCFLSSWILYLLSLNLFATFLRNDLLWKIGQKESNSRICTVYFDVRAAPCTEGEMQRQFMRSLRNILRNSILLHSNRSHLLLQFCSRSLCHLLMSVLFFTYHQIQQWTSSAVSFLYNNQFILSLSTSDDTLAPSQLGRATSTSGINLISLQYNVLHAKFSFFIYYIYENTTKYFRFCMFPLYFKSPLLTFYFFVMLFPLFNCVSFIS